jgi:hypothetical protein
MEEIPSYAHFSVLAACRSAHLRCMKHEVWT